MMLDIKRLRQKYFYKLKDELYSVNTASEIYFALALSQLKVDICSENHCSVSFAAGGC